MTWRQPDTRHIPFKGLHFIFSSLLCVCFILLYFSQAIRAEETEAIKIYVGLFPIKIYQLDLKSEQFQADFYMWLRWKGPKKVPEFEIMNGDYELVGDAEKDELIGGYHYAAYRIKGTFFPKINLKDYPFDKHTLEIQVENQEMDRSEALYVPDRQNIEALKKNSAITGWNITDLNTFERKHVYDTDFGKSEDADTSEFSQFVYQLKIERRVFSYVIKYTIPLFIIVLMAFLTFFIHPEETEARCGIVITAVLSIIAFHISQVDALPEVGYLVAADYFFILSYIACGLSLIEVVIAHIFILREDVESAIKLDHKAKLVMPVLYLLSFMTIMMEKIW